MRQPEGFIEADKKNLICRLKKSLYGLKQAPRQWYKKFDNFMSSSGSDMQEIINLKQKLSKQFAMKDLGAAKQILGMRIKRDTKSGTLILSQAEYMNKVLSRFNMQDAKPVSTPLGVHFRLSKEQSPKTEEERAHMVKVTYASAIGSLMYAMVCTRPDITHTVGAVSRYMNNPGKPEMLTSEEALQEASKEMVWLQSFLEELGKKQENNILYCDSQSVIHLAKNPSFHSRTKHIQL
ncbi:hypothetical protein F3Y22_tig00112253pilonHSYRG00128 [Hibiscus syriacus]|uniref:Reverse transcriptase Ty1/copia-type domain-containing protein n=1 Tax=Hibiscus syriacus TaxID=106335 RepID=A0A6A2X2P9_HIBSY|nr:hypothetical protein F3Y22_tig00112253pilonHSYRG00128 [Hibiscus syriacus]